MDKERKNIVKDIRKPDNLSLQLPPLGERVRIILGNKKDSKNLARAIRATRKGETGEFEVSEETMKIILKQCS